MIQPLCGLPDRCAHFLAHQRTCVHVPLRSERFSAIATAKIHLKRQTYLGHDAYFPWSASALQMNALLYGVAARLSIAIELILRFGR